MLQFYPKRLVTAWIAGSGVPAAALLGRCTTMDAADDTEQPADDPTDFWVAGIVVIAVMAALAAVVLIV